ncbi:hypothetical protein [Homoserinibacter gongjuensis]|uniref:Uncharacterized protein n=1 Tax=Homoserinibacter gongjuensis TaxID=1162968 RepID=A0ABQ6JP52_9MICO|nr:hypothetical protein [Homoserinibacter gongjuensis]GMA89527.1 hypothetical protein GCM10025869_00560 [Homoserinibacter gongjuensis]
MSAPALVVVSLVLGALLLFPRIASLAERGVARRPQTGVLAARSVARRLALAATPIALVALAASQLIIAAGFAGSWSAPKPSLMRSAREASCAWTLAPRASARASSPRSRGSWA